MIRPSGLPNRNQLKPFGAIQEEPVQIAETKINGGLVTEIDPSDISPNQMAILKNYRIFADRVLRSPGKTEISNTKPNSNKILLYCSFERFAGTSTALRFTAITVYKNAGSGWTLLTTGAALTASDTDAISFVTINDRFFFANGVDKIQEVNTGITAYSAITSSSPYKYLCGFFNRLVAANSNTNPILIGWSGDLNFTQFNPVTDISAGSVSLVEGQSDYAEPITGLFGFASVMLILREKSLWLATKQPSATNPFLFTAAFPGTGCDCPKSATQTGDGIAWFDYRTCQVYSYKVEGRPEPIGTAIRSQLRTLVSNKDSVRASYDAINNQYILVIPSTTSNTTSIFGYDFQTQSWYMEEVENVVGVFHINDGGSTLTFGDLAGTFGSLMGTFADLVFTSIVIPARLYGTTDGELLEDSVDSDDSNGITMESTLQSKVFAVVKEDVNITELYIKYIPRRAGSFTVRFSRDKGETFTDYKTVTFTGLDLGKRKTAICRRNLRVEEYVFQIVSEEGRFELLEYSLHGVSAADKSED